MSSVLYRGQPLEPRIGFWWSDRREDAQEFARQCRSWVVLRVEVSEDFARKYLRFTVDDHAGLHGNWYRIPHERLVTQSLAVDVIAGRIAFSHDLITTTVHPVEVKQKCQ